MIVVSAIGWKAHAALRRCGGVARVLAPLTGSAYLLADGEMIWLGSPASPLHPRAALTAASPVTEAQVARIDAGTVRPWRAAPLTLSAATAGLLADSCRRLRAVIPEIGTPDGLAALLITRASGATRGFGLELAAVRATALARACGANDAGAARAAAIPLLGLGPGLTPSGDDYVGGAFFARTLLARARAVDAAAWRAAADDVCARAPALTHPISAALLADHLAGDGHAPLHDLAQALAAGGSLEAAVDAAQRLVRLGHSSGWDILAGFVGGLTGP